MDLVNVKEFFYVFLQDSPHKCHVCSRTFNQRSNLKTHLLTHSDVKPFTCDICSKFFRRNCDLRRHILTHTEGDVIDVCSMSNDVIKMEADHCRSSLEGSEGLSSWMFILCWKLSYSDMFQFLVKNKLYL